MENPYGFKEKFKQFKQKQQKNNNNLNKNY